MYERIGGENLNKMIGEKLTTYWKTNGVQILPGASEAQIEAFETKYQVIFPDDLRAYFLHVNGMTGLLDGGIDSNGFYFLPLNQIVSGRDELIRVSCHRPIPPGLKYYFIFVDYFQWSWTYAIRLSPDKNVRNSVRIVGGNSDDEIACSFTEFVDLYIADSPILYGQH
jgi:hypothetical protein